MSTLKSLFLDALHSGRRARNDNYFNLTQTQERARFSKSMPGETAMKEATRLYANGR